MSDSKTHRILRVGRSLRFALAAAVTVVVMASSTWAQGDQVGAPSTDPIYIENPTSEQTSVVLPLNKARVLRPLSPEHHGSGSWTSAF